MTAADVLAGKANWSVEQSDCLPWLRALPAGCVHCAVTSPPYFALRSYLPKGHALKAQELGSEKSLSEYLAQRWSLSALNWIKQQAHSGKCFEEKGSGYEADDL